MSEHQPGQEVDAEDPGVPNDPPGPDVPTPSGGSLAPDVPTAPQVDQPEGVADVEGADPQRDEQEPETDDTDSPPGAGDDEPPAEAEMPA